MKGNKVNQKKHSKKVIPLIFFLITLIVMAGLLAGCSTKMESSAYGWTLIKYFSGDSNLITEKFTFTKKSNQIWVKTTKNKPSGLQARILSSDDKVVGMYSVGDKQMEDIWTLNIEPGDYYLEIKTNGTKYEIKAEER